MSMQIIDAYGRVGVPRFMTGDEFVGQMDATGVQRAAIAQADTCPDVMELSRAAVGHPQRIRAVGMPVGDAPQEIRRNVADQMACGFLGIRLPSGLVGKQPELLDVIGDAGGVPYVVGRPIEAAGAIVAFLQRYPAAVVCAPHFAGGGNPSLLEECDEAAELFDHPRFAVIFSRHGAFDRRELLAWAEAVVARVGWQRILYGSEYPVCLWRNESYRSTIEWIDGVPFAPGPSEKEACLGGNARRLLFSRELASPSLVPPGCQRLDLMSRRDIWLFGDGTIDLPGEAHRRLLRAYLAAGGECDYKTFVERVLADAAQGLELPDDE